MKKISIILFIGIFISSCKNQDPNEFIPTKDLGNAIFDNLIFHAKDIDIKERRISFENSLTLFIKPQEFKINLNDQEFCELVFEFSTTFKNNLEKNLIIRKPLNARLDNIYSNVQFVIESQDGEMVDYPHPGFIYYIDPPLYSDIIEDFIELKPGEEYSLVQEIEFPLSHLLSTDNCSISQELEEYYVYLVYQNYDVGYNASPEEWISESYLESLKFDSLEQRSKWYIDHYAIVDLNSWVGEITSNRIRLSIIE